MDKHYPELDTYEIRENDELGSGGFSRVYRAWHKRLQKDVVVKRIFRELNDDINVRADADNLKNLHNTYLPQVYDYIEADGESIIVMDYIEGKTLEQCLEDGMRMKQKDIIKWGIQLCSAVEYLHSQKPPLIHGDIKPANVMRKPDGTICLIDFNIAAPKGEKGAKVIGCSEGYSPPEQYIYYQENGKKAQPRKSTDEKPAGYGSKETVPLSGIANPSGTKETVLLQKEEASGGGSQTRPLTSQEEKLLSEAAPAKEAASYALIDERSDLYSIGATLYSLVMGIPPAKYPKDLVPLEKSSIRITDGLAYTIQKAMQQKPEKRFKSASRMKRSLENVVRINRAYKRVVHMQEIMVLCIVLLFGGFFLMNQYGSRVMAEEKEAAYEESVEWLRDSRAMVGEEEYRRRYEEAISYYPERTAPYYEMTYALYLSGEYEEVIQYVETEVLNRYELEYGTEMADICFLEANAYFEMERYEEAIPRFAQAIYLNDNNVEYYRDYAISLARIGELEKASEVLAQAEERRLADDSVYLIRGEIELGNGDLESAKKHLTLCIETTQDDYMRMRAAVVLSELYDERKEELLAAQDPEYQQVLEEQIALLERMLLTISGEYTPALREQLVQAYLDASAYTGDAEYDRLAVNELQELVSLNWDSYFTHNNLAILYQKLDQYDKAREELEQMLTEYGEDYNVYKRLAFLEIDLQSAQKNEERDYAEFAGYYDKAMELYNEVQSNNRTDAEMNVLEEAMDALRRGGWL